MFVKMNTAIILYQKLFTSYHFVIVSELCLKMVEPIVIMGNPFFILSRTATAYTSALYGQASGTIWLDELQCNGTERDIAMCGNPGWGVGDCGHSEDAGVLCGQDKSEFWLLKNTSVANWHFWVE